MHYRLQKQHADSPLRMRKIKCAGNHVACIAVYVYCMMAKLSLDELKLVLSEVSSVCEKWYCIGYELDLPVDYLEDLDTQLSAEKIDVGSCLRKVLVKWIKSKQATWSTLIKALGGDLVGEEGLASGLHQKYGASSLGEHFNSILATDTSIYPLVTLCALAQQRVTNAVLVVIVTPKVQR